MGHEANTPPALEEEPAVVVRIVYDGLPFSGKTTSLRALAKRLGVEVTTPAEQDGRTLFFDWAEYVGGRFDGRKIHCHILTVPGQTEFAARRRAILQSADAVVFVADSRGPALEENLERLTEVVAACQEQVPPVGVVVQANKRDAPQCVPAGVLRERLRLIGPLAMTETVATDGDGVRETFVFGVRLALDRVRACDPGDEGRRTRGRTTTPTTLLASLREAESNTDETAFERAARSSRALEKCAEQAPACEGVTPAPALSAAPDVPVELPFRPDPMSPGGLIWPPVHGRALLHEIATHGLVPTQARDGHWRASAGGFRCHSACDASFASLDQARGVLIEWARMHAGRLELLSQHRVLVVADAGHGRYRLWQLWRCEPALRERLAAVLPCTTTQRAVQELTVAAQHLVHAHARFHADGASLPCSLWSVGLDGGGRPVFAEAMPSPHEALATKPSLEDCLRHEFAPVLQGLRRDRDDFRWLASRLIDAAAQAPGDAAKRALAQLGECALADG